MPVNHAKVEDIKRKITSTVLQRNGSGARLFEGDGLKRLERIAIVALETNFSSECFRHRSCIYRRGYPFPSRTTGTPAW